MRLLFRFPLALALAGVLAVGGCAAGAGSASPRQQTVFAPGGVSLPGVPATTVDIVDIGTLGLDNISRYTVRLAAVELVGAPRAVHVLHVYALYDGHIGAEFGDVFGRCRSLVRPLSDIVLTSHSQEPWEVLVEFRIDKPGRYSLPRG